MVEPTLTSVDRTERIEQEFEALVLGVDHVEHFYPYRDEEIPPNSVCMYFDWRGTTARATSGISRKSWEWMVDIYIHGYEREDVQRRMKEVIIGIDAALDRNPKLNRAASKPVSTSNTGPARPIRTDSGGFGLLKQFRLSVEGEERV